MANTFQTGVDDFSEGTAEVPIAWLARLEEYLAEARDLHQRQYGPQYDVGKEFLRDLTALQTNGRLDILRLRQRMQALRDHPDYDANVVLRLFVSVPAPQGSHNPIDAGFEFMRRYWRLLLPYIAVEEAECYDSDGELAEGDVDDIRDKFWNQ